MENNKMLALSWKQPFGTAMLHGKIETRSWNTNYRGPVLICTSKRRYEWEAVKRISGEDLLDQMIGSMNSLTGTADMNGYAIAVGNLIDCRPMVKEDEAKTFVQFREGLYCHVYADVRPIKPFPWKGSQGWKTVDPEIVKNIEFY